MDGYGGLRIEGVLWMGDTQVLLWVGMQSHGHKENYRQACSVNDRMSITGGHEEFSKSRSSMDWYKGLRIKGVIRMGMRG